VLQCNGYDVVDLGVMVPCDKILAAAKEHKVDMIGLSGLITPSLDEMVYVGKEMQRLKMDMPLLIGGATTSKTHTAVKIEPAYKNGATVYVTDASRAVGVVGQLLGEGKDDYTASIRTDYEKARESHQRGQNKKARYPAILEDDRYGEAARDLFKDANAMLDTMIAEKWVKANAVYGFWPAGQKGDDVAVFTDESRGKTEATFHGLRQQISKGGNGKPNYSISDFCAPEGVGLCAR